MENEIKVGEYVRTREGEINRITEILNDDSDVLTYYCFENNMGTLEKAIVKHSPNLIDLIEVGDMVHTKDVLNEEWYWMFDEEMVKATKETIEEGVALIEIVTKEMMESISYKVTKM